MELEQLCPTIQEQFGDGPWISHKDGAACHKHKSDSKEKLRLKEGYFGQSAQMQENKQKENIKIVTNSKQQRLRYQFDHF